MKFILPLRVQQSKKKLFSLNLNQYRNAHYQTLSNVKNTFSDIFSTLFGQNETKITEAAWLKYTIFFPDNRAADLGNIGAIVDKFTSDCLTKYGYIEDDNRRIVKRISFDDGGIDRENPRAELELIEMKKGI
jgi:hypothetical protein